MVILLFGLSNVGKTTTGRILAEKLGYTFLDLDAEIKKHYQMTVDEFQKMYPLPRERDAQKGLLIKHLVKKNPEKVVIAITPMFYKANYRNIIARKNVIAIELLDSAENIFDRLVFADANDVPYEDIEYKNRYKKHYIKEINDDIRFLKKAYDIIENKFYMNNMSPDAVADGLVELIKIKTDSR